MGARGSSHAPTSAAVPGRLRATNVPLIQSRHRAMSLLASFSAASNWGCERRRVNARRPAPSSWSAGSGSGQNGDVGHSR